MTPDDQDADCVHEDDQQHLGEHRIAQPERRLDGAVETRQIFLGNQLSLQKLQQQRAHPEVHDQLRNDEQRHRHQKADVDFHVLQKRHPGITAEQMSFPTRTTVAAATTSRAR
jgi:hypothetical protein